MSYAVRSESPAIVFYAQALKCSTLTEGIRFLQTCFPTLSEEDATALYQKDLVPIFNNDGDQISSLAEASV